MGYAVLPAPGTKLGPCEPRCQHRDCLDNRRLAESPCAICSKPIGYDTPFFSAKPGQAEPLVHADCEYNRLDAEAQAKAAGVPTGEELALDKCEEAASDRAWDAIARGKAVLP